MAIANNRRSTHSPRNPHNPSPLQPTTTRCRAPARTAYKTAHRSRRSASEVPAPRLLALDRLEQCLEVALAEAASAVPLDDLEEDRRTITNQLGKDLQQIPLVVAVDKDAEPAQIS